MNQSIKRFGQFPGENLQNTEKFYDFITVFDAPVTMLMIFNQICL